MKRFIAALVAACLSWAPIYSVAMPRGAIASTSANVSITGGTIGGSPISTGVTVILLKGGIPLISLATGTMTAGGAMTVGTALPTTYPNAYCYFPANTVATSIAAGYYYCTFSSATSGTAFQNPLPATGVPTIPASPTAVVAGSNWTGDTGEEFGPTVNVAAGAMGANGALRVSSYYLQTNNANAKTARVRFSGNGGTIFFSDALASLGSAGFIGQIANAGAAIQTSQIFAKDAGSMTSGTSGTINTAPATTLVFSLQKATATDNIVMYPNIVELISDGT